MSIVPTLTELDLTYQRVLIREDFNVPIIQDRILNDRRIIASIPTIEYALSQNAAVILVSHLGRPTLQDSKEKFSLQPVADALSTHLNQPVKLLTDWIDGITIQPGEVVLCENVRKLPGESSNDVVLAKRMANLANIIVMDAFAVAHRRAASTVGIIQQAKQVCSGLLLATELENLQAFSAAKGSLVGLIGGGKTSSKIHTLEALVKKVDSLLLGGDIACLFLAAQFELAMACHYLADELSTARHILELAKQYDCHIHLPLDHLVDSLYDSNHQAPVQIKSTQDIVRTDNIRDIGPKTIAYYTKKLTAAGKIIWNGPVGLFENPDFSKGTQAMAEAISDSDAFSIAGGGETLAAIDQYQCYPSCLSTGGGALLEYMATGRLVAIDALKENY